MFFRCSLTVRTLTHKARPSFLAQPHTLRFGLVNRFKLHPMRPSQALSQHRDAVCQAAARYRVANPRVFGSALHGHDVEGSDLDLLVDPLPGTTLFDLGGLQDELQTLLGVSVDVLTPKDLPPKFRDAVVQEARPL